LCKCISRSFCICYCFFSAKLSSSEYQHRFNRRFYNSFEGAALCLQQLGLLPSSSSSSSL
jgi:hypothetical protein